MSGALCIDFGTSSIRAVRRLPGGKLKPLDIGRVTRSKLDLTCFIAQMAVGRSLRLKR